MRKAMRIAVVGAECVSCGCCVKECPRSAIHIHCGIMAVVDGQKCVGCGKCEKVCPAAVIIMAEREASV